MLIVPVRRAAVEEGVVEENRGRSVDGQADALERREPRVSDRQDGIDDSGLPDVGVGDEADAVGAASDEEGALVRGNVANRDPDVRNL